MDSFVLPPELSLLAGSLIGKETFVTINATGDQIVGADTTRFALYIFNVLNNASFMSTNGVEGPGSNGLEIPHNGSMGGIMTFRDWGPLIQVPWFVTLAVGPQQYSVFEVLWRPKR